MNGVLLRGDIPLKGGVEGFLLNRPTGFLRKAVYLVGNEELHQI